MFKFLQEPKFPIAIFITASFLSLLVLFSLFLFSGIRSSDSPQELSGRVLNRYYLKDRAGLASDPYISLYPGLNALLEGPVITSADPIMGSLEAPVTITVFSDFSCQYCRQQEETVKKLVARFGQSVNFLRKDYPDFDENSYSYQAAAAGRCAFEQGRYWDYHDMLFSDKKTAPFKFFIDLAEQAGLDKEAFLDCFESDRPGRQIKNNMEEASVLEIPGIPFLYVNDQEIFGEIKESGLSQIVEIEIKKAGSR